jgi:hypothetical protein
LAAITLLLVSPLKTRAQIQDFRWSELFRLSTEEGQGSEPWIVSDNLGYTHVFWTETGWGDDRTYIMYARFDGYNWSTPVDIQFTLPNIPIGVVAPAVDENGILHVVSSLGDYGPVFYTSAPASKATSAQAWSTPVRLRVPAYKMKLMVDSKGTLHLLYSRISGTEPGLYYMKSENQGQTWTEPYWLDPDMPITLSPSVLQLELGEDDSLHALWYYVDLRDITVPGRWIRYSHSFDGGETWSNPTTIDRVSDTSDELRLPSPLMRVQGDIVHVIWAGDYSTHRKHRYSTDGGNTWSEPTFIMGDLIGQALGDGAVIDSKGRLHFASQLRWPQGVYYSMWDKGVWTPPEMVYLVARDASDPIGERVHAHRVRMSIQGGNQLVLCFTTAPSQPQTILYCTQRVLADLPASELQIIPEATAPAVETPIIESTKTPTPIPTPTPVIVLPVSASPPRISVTTTFSIILLGVVPVLLFLVGTFLYLSMARRNT